ncbi:hypothetical protein GCM10017786_51030 [Amycolatopsis deserti]|uniref:Uncharacterized protein n=1 Tax=Amycolatopsis deserti TaxID=185696 RepID=A0ABQ3JCR9_9PSEU|nr:hypothetical protein [Amycolatopsis deserti]GHF11120.1 hypothetical protein GCM10017786_51030 [Amycolatopsis deserti]
MQGRTRRTAAAGAAAFVLAGSAALALPATASAETLTAQCGDTVTAKPGDVIKTPLGLKTVTDGLTSIVGGLLGGLCQITVKVVDTVVEPLPAVGAPAASAVNGAVTGTTNGLTSTVDQAGRALSGGGAAQPQPQNPPSSGGNQQTPPGSTPGRTGGVAPAAIPGSTSPVLGGDPATFSLLPFGSGSAYAPMRNYAGLPFAVSALWAPSPGLKYGGQIPGYAPQYGALGQPAQSGQSVQNAGRAEALPSGSGGGGNVALPMLIAVVALSGVSAGLVRAWVLRGATA